MSSMEIKSTLSWGDKILHTEYGEGIVIREQIGLVQILFKDSDNKTVSCRMDDPKLRYLEGNF